MIDTSSFYAIAIASGVGVVSFFSAVGIVDTVSPPPPRSLELVDVRFEGGKFHQTHRVHGASSLRADWAAEIVRGDVHLCSGGATSVYTSGTNAFSPNDWTGSQCPPLQPGDIGRAVWEYTTAEGYKVSITGEAVVE